MLDDFETNCYIKLGAEVSALVQPARIENFETSASSATDSPSFGCYLLISSSQLKPSVS